MRRVLTLALAAAATLALVPAAALARTVRFRLPVPTAGDVTLARAQFLTAAGTSVAARTLGTASLAQDVRVAVLIRRPFRSGGQTLHDVFFAVAAPIESGAATNPSSFTVEVGSDRGRVRLVHLLAVGDALARANKSDSTCPALSGGFSQVAHPQAAWLVGGTGPRWAGLSARTFALDAFHYGCGDGLAAGGGRFAQSLLAPANSLWATWRQLGDGTVRVCEYLTGAPGTRGTIDLVGASGSLGARPYTINADGLGGAAWVTTPGTFHVALTSPLGSINGADFAVPPGTDGSPPPVAQQVDLGAC